MAHPKLSETLDLLAEFEDMDLGNIIMQASKLLCERSGFEPSLHGENRCVSDNPGYIEAQDYIFDGAVIAHVNVCPEQACKAHGLRETED